MSIEKIAERPLSAYDTTNNYSSSASIQQETMTFPANIQQNPTVYDQRPWSTPPGQPNLNTSQQKPLQMSGYVPYYNPYADQTGQRNIMKERLKYWFVQYPIKPILQVKSRKQRSKDQKDLASNKYTLYPKDTPIQNLIDKQVVNIEPSTQQDKIYKLTNQKGATFTDDVFPADQISLCGQKLYNPQWQGVVWKPATHMNPQANIFTDDISPNDIRQGMLGDCYFLAALAALAEIPTRIYDLFLQTSKNNTKYYVCKVMYKGKWKAIYLDDYIPTYQNRPAFSGYSKNDMWVTLLEKAWAKLYSSYQRISAGYTEEGLHDLTGAHIQQWRFRTANFNLLDFWNYLLKATEREYAMVGATLPGSDQNIPASGVVFGHAYTVLGAYEVTISDGRRFKIVQCRNPWGKTDSKLRWNDFDPVWNYVSQQEKRRIGFAPQADDGLFFLSLRDFIDNFTMLTSAEINDQASYVYLTQDARDNRGKFFKVEIYRQGEYSLQVNSIPQRRYPETYSDQYEYPQTTLNIGLLQGNSVKYLEGTQSAFRTLFKKHVLMPGTYIVFVEVAFNPVWQTDYEITLGIYADYPCNITIPKPSESSNFFSVRYLERALNNSVNKLNQHLTYRQQITKDGFAYVVIHNDSNYVYRVRLSVLNNRNPTVKIMPPNHNKDVITKDVRGHHLETIIARIGSYDYETTAICEVEDVTRIA